MPDNNQLIERLRRKATKRGLAAITHPSLLNEAADTIEHLEASLADERKKAADAARFAEKRYEEVSARR